MTLPGWWRKVLLLAIIPVPRLLCKPEQLLHTSLDLAVTKNYTHPPVVLSVTGNGKDEIHAVNDHSATLSLTRCVFAIL